MNVHTVPSINLLDTWDSQYFANRAHHESLESTISILPDWSRTFADISVYLGHEWTWLCCFEFFLLINIDLIAVITD
jgi:hypothetical protein